MAFFESVGVLSILPFITVLSNPSIIDTNLLLNKFFQISKFFSVESKQEFVFLLGIFTLILLVLSLMVKAITSYLQFRFIQMLQYNISKRLIKRYLSQPYSWFLNRHSADLGKTILTETGEVIVNGINPMLELISKGTVIIAIMTMLIVVDPKLAIIVMLSISLSYALIFYFIKSFISSIGDKRLKNNKLRFLAVGEAFNAIKEIKISRLEENYIKHYSKSAKIFAKTQAYFKILTILPRFFLEALAFGGILLIILYSIKVSGNFNKSIPIIALYAFAGYRLLPAIQQIYSSFSAITFSGPAIKKLYNEFDQTEEINFIQNQSELSFNKEIKLKNIYYNYPNSSKTAIKNINLIIPARSKIGFVGTTGSGKTTTVDIILGLLKHNEGSLEVDGNVINENNIRSWQSNIGYVPQHIYLSDNTIAANIAFGLDSELINQKSVEDACKIAKIHDFIINDLTKGYQTTIGERGVRLSGGELQRLGIARALYKNPKLLILDEATSSLDNRTQNEIIKTLNEMSEKMTIIIIAHRLNTVKMCDTIYRFENGEIKNQGKFTEILNLIEN